MVTAVAELQIKHISSKGIYFSYFSAKTYDTQLEAAWRDMSDE